MLLLLRNEADFNRCIEDGATPLFIACDNGHERIVKLLINYGANIHLCKEDGVSPLIIACKNGH